MRRNFVLMIALGGFFLVMAVGTAAYWFFVNPTFVDEKLLPEPLAIRSVENKIVGLWVGHNWDVFLEFRPDGTYFECNTGDVGHLHVYATETEIREKTKVRLKGKYKILDKDTVEFQREKKDLIEYYRSSVLGARAATWFEKNPDIIVWREKVSFGIDPYGNGFQAIELRNDDYVISHNLFRMKPGETPPPSKKTPPPGAGR